MGEIRFGRYRLDPGKSLRRGRTEVHVTPKSLALLGALAERAGEIVSKEDLFNRVWPDTSVSDAALTSCIQELRRVLQDDARKPRFIQTVHRRGYRFKPSSKDRLSHHPVSGASGYAGAPVGFVGRRSAVDTLHDHLTRALRGSRQAVCIVGEPGAGKTALVQAFLASHAGAARVMRGECVERYGIGEAYGPLLEALTRGCQQPDGRAALDMLRRHAPTWLAQLPSVVSPAQHTILVRRAAGATRDRMLRELTHAVEAMSADIPTILWLEDLHWSDESTLDWIAAFMQRPEPSRTMVIGTWRSGASLHGVSRWTHVALEPLTRDEVREHAATRYPPGARDHARDRLADLVWERTGGIPLFVTAIFGDLEARGIVSCRHGEWTVPREAGEATLRIPDSVRRMIELQIERLAPEDRNLLEIAAVLGPTCCSAAVAAAAGLQTAAVDGSLLTLSRRTPFVHGVAVQEWPDGTTSGAFTFTHAVYRDVFRDRVGPGRAADAHLRIGRRLTAAYGDRTQDIAGALAVHFEEGRDLASAAAFRRAAADTARRRGAYREAHHHLDRAIAMVQDLPPSSARDLLEASLCTALGPILMATRGWGAPEVERAYERARTLCRTLENTPQLFPALWGLWLFYWGRGSLDDARELAGTLLVIAREADDAALLLQAHHAGWATCFSRGELHAAIEHVRHGMALYERGAHAALAPSYGDHDAGVCGRMFGARALALVGQASEAVRCGEDAIALARELDQPFTLSLALVFVANVHHLLRDLERARHHASEAARIAADHGFRLVEGWAMCVGGAAGPGGSQQIRAIEEGIAAARATGSDQFLPYLFGLLASAQLQAGAGEAARAAASEGLAIAGRTGERFFEAELHRLVGEGWQHRGSHSDTGEDALAEAARSFERAMAVARAQGAELLAVRAAISLARLSFEGALTGARR